MYNTSQVCTAARHFTNLLLIGGKQRQIVNNVLITYEYIGYIRVYVHYIFLNFDIIKLYCLLLIHNVFVKLQALI